MADDVIITTDDLEGFPGINLPGDEARLEKMIEDALAMASLTAPCILEDEFLEDTKRVGQVRAVLRGAIVRWNESGSGAATNLVSGPFQATLDTRQPRKSLFWPSELSQLRDICDAFNGKTKSKVFAIDTSPSPSPSSSLHAEICSVFFGGLCSCGSSLNDGQGPIFGGVP